MRESVLRLCLELEAELMAARHVAEEAAFTPGVLGEPDAAAALRALFHAAPPPGPLPPHVNVQWLLE